MKYVKFVVRFAILFAIGLQLVSSSDILMITMGGTKSHKIPFWELSKGLIPRGHRITFLNGFEPDFHIDGLNEVTPQRLVRYIQNYTDWDLLGTRYAGKAPISLRQAMRYPSEACNSLLSDTVMAELLTEKFHLAVIDGAFPECALGIVYRLGVPFMYINTVGFYTGSLARAGNPIAYAVTPHVFTALTQRMDLRQRVLNYITHRLSELVHMYYTHQVHAVLRAHIDPRMPHPYILARNVSFVLQNGHASVTYPRPFYPNVAEIACIHCRPGNALPPELEEFMSSAPAGVIFLSMGSSVRAANMPEALRRLLVSVFARLPQYHVLWKWESTNATQMADVSANVRLSAWLPQQDILAHRKLRVFVTHGGLLSMYEAIYHGVPMVMLPVFCDHDVNTAKAAADGYAVHLPLEGLTGPQLYRALNEVIHNRTYRRAIRVRRSFLLDQPAKPLSTAIFWTEYVLRHQGAEQLQAPTTNMNFFIYHSLDVLLLLSFAICCCATFIYRLLRKIFNCIRNMKQKRD